MSIRLNRLKRALKSNSESLICQELTLVFQEIYFGNSRTTVDVFDISAIEKVQNKFNDLLLRVNPFIPLTVGICRWSGEVHNITTMHLVRGQLVSDREFITNTRECRSCHEVSFYQEMREVRENGNLVWLCPACNTRRQEEINRRRVYVASYSDNPMSRLESFRGTQERKGYIEIVSTYKGKSRTRRKYYDLRNPTKDIFFGVELEVTPKSKLENLEYLEITHEAVKDFCILKSDSSLGEHGFEIVSVPATLDYHRVAWDSFFEAAKGVLVGWKDRRCGMHVHFNLDAISELTLGKMMVFVNRSENSRFITHVAGRGENNYNIFSDKRIANGKLLIDENGLRGRMSMRQALNRQVYSHQRSENNNRYFINNYSSHHEALSISEHTGKTAELRIFQSNVSKNGFMKNLDFTHALIKFCEQTSINKLDFKDFIAWLDRPENKTAKFARSYPYLYSWAVKALYIVGKKEKRGFEFGEE